MPITQPKEPNYDIRITGNGTQKEIVHALEKVLLTLKASVAKELDDMELENATLHTEVWSTSNPPVKEIIK
jgi:hypothetical protein